MGPPLKQIPVLSHEMKPTRPRRGSLPELKSSEKDKNLDKKTPTGPRANPLYKTRLCMNYQTTGSCPYTEKCQFAHGIEELQKWEAWRSSHKSDEKKDDRDSISPMTFPSEPRSRSQSEEPSKEDDIPISHFLNWDLNTPIKQKDPVTPMKFSYWSSVLDDIENEHPLLTQERRPLYIPSERRPLASMERERSATYDNISQLRDAPTLFSSPPILPQLNNSNYRKMVQ